MKVLLKIGYYLFILVSLCILLLQPHGRGRYYPEQHAYATSDKSEFHLLRGMTSSGFMIPMIWKSDHFPIPVWYSESVREYVRDPFILEQAINVWNDFLEKEVFVISDEAEMRGIVVNLAYRIFQQPQNRELLGICYYHYNEEALTSVDLELSIIAIEQMIMFRTLVHELGHSIGFAHANDPRYIMFPIISRENLNEPFTSDFYLSPELISAKARQEFESYYVGTDQ